LIIFDLNQGVRITTLVLIVLQAISAVTALISIGKHGEYAIWSLIYSGIFIFTLGLVGVGMQRNIQFYLLPALYMVLISIVIGILNSIICVFLIQIFNAIWILFTECVAAYYFCALKSVHDDMGSAGETIEPV